LLYKILDMLTYVKIKFVFLATSMKLDVADGFEKRIKSRFSHRQVLLYSLELPIFDKVLNQVFDRLAVAANKTHRDKGLKAVEELRSLAGSPAA
jgi:hypothetical protein